MQIRSFKSLFPAYVKQHIFAPFKRKLVSVSFQQLADNLEHGCVGTGPDFA